MQLLDSLYQAESTVHNEQWNHEGHWSVVEP